MQLINYYALNDWHELCLPSAESALNHLPGVKWGKPGHLFSPAFWRFQHWVHVELQKQDAPRCNIASGTLLEEIVACLLGGYGLPAETSMAYFQKMKATGFFDRPPTSISEVEEFLRHPVVVSGSSRRYRFWRSKARPIWAAMVKHRAEIENLEHWNGDALVFRNRLTQLPGIGLKTASWICRNWCKDGNVAVLDIHIVRSLTKLGCSLRPVAAPKNYYEAEKCFLDLCRSLGTPSDSLDLVMWAITRQIA